MMERKKEYLLQSYICLTALKVIIVSSLSCRTPLWLFWKGLSRKCSSWKTKKLNLGWPEGLWPAKCLNAYKENKWGSVLAFVGGELFFQDICMKFAWLLCGKAVKQVLFFGLYFSVRWLQNNQTYFVQFLQHHTKTVLTTMVQTLQ